MAEHLRAFIVVFVLSSVTFVLLRRPAMALGMAEVDFRRRRNFWLAITALAFFANSFWIFVLGAGVLLVFAQRADQSPMSLYLFLLFVVPPFGAALPGLGIVNQLFELSFPRLLSLLVLVPWVMRADPTRVRFGRHPCDWAIVAFLALQLLLQVRNDSLTNTLRYAFYAWLDAFLPYYVASRASRSTKDLKEAILSLAIAAVVMASIASFEFVKQWLLYSALPASLGMHWDGGSYLPRGDYLRALASTGHPLVLGYVFAMAMLLLAGIEHDGTRARSWWALQAAMAVGLMASVSRGPWIGVVVGVVVIAAATRKPTREVFKVAAWGAVACLAILASPWRDRVVDLLPFVGTVDRGNIDYRQQLIDASLLVISQNPLLGSPYFMLSGPMEQLRIGGLIDVVNTYLLVALNTGYVGLASFALIFGLALVSVIRALVRQTADDADRHLQGRALLGAVVGHLVIIATVSNILFIPIVYWCLVGLTVGYALAESRGIQPASRRAVLDRNMA